MRINPTVLSKVFGVFFGGEGEQSRKRWGTERDFGSRYLCGNHFMIGQQITSSVAFVNRKYSVTLNSGANYLKMIYPLLFFRNKESADAKRLLTRSPPAWKLKRHFLPAQSPVRDIFCQGRGWGDLDGEGRRIPSCGRQMGRLRVPFLVLAGGWTEGGQGIPCPDPDWGCSWYPGPCPGWGTLLQLWTLLPSHRITYMDSNYARTWKIWIILTSANTINLTIGECRQIWPLQIQETWDVKDVNSFDMRKCDEPMVYRM